MNPRRLYRSRDRQLAGVAGGMAEYLDVDPTVIRIGWILVTVVTGGLALIAYLLLALVIPQSPYAAGSVWPGQPASAPGWAAPGSTGGPGASGSPAGWSGSPAYGGQGWSVPPTTPQWQYAPAPARPESRGLGAAGIVGIVLVVIGALALTDVVVPGIRVGAIVGPAILLALGAALVASSVRRPVDGVAAPAAAAPAPGAAGEPVSGSWASATPDMTPWSASTPAPAPSTSASTLDPDATATDVPTVSGPADEPPTNPA